MKLYVDTSAKQITVTLEPVEKKDQNGRQRTERDTGRPMWSTEVFVLDDEGGTVVRLLTPTQVLALADAMPHRYAPLVLLGAIAGLRQGEAFGLCVQPGRPRHRNDCRKSAGRHG